jgi:hypothetical protein
MSAGLCRDCGNAALPGSLLCGPCERDRLMAEEDPETLLVEEAFDNEIAAARLERRTDVR